MPAITERRKYTVPQLARLWGVSTNKILAFVRSGELRATNLALHTSARPPTSPTSRRLRPRGP
jgi:hypothetical protein